MESFEALLKESAELGAALAEQHCNSRVYGTRQCAWYHGVWQFFSLLGVVASPHRDEAFYKRALAETLRTGKTTKVLISGCSDYAMLDVARTATMGSRSSVRIAVADTCETPLHLNRWYADRQGFQIETIAGDILELDQNSEFDVICTHSFLGNFEPANRPRVVAAWRRLLRPGGSVVLVNRVRPGQSEISRFSPLAAQDFIEQVACRTDQLGLTANPTADTAIQWAKIYTEKYRSYPVASTEELRDLFEKAGFHLSCFETKFIGDKATGPSAAGGGGMRVNVIARRST